MNKITFNVLDDSWIPVIYKNGRVCEVGINDCFREAHLIYSISNNPPYEKIAILRLLTAFATDAYDLKRRKDREKLYDQGAFQIEIFEKYEQDCLNKYGASFDLFDEERPFMSFGFDKKIDHIGTKLSAAYLHLHLPHGDNPVHIVAQTEDNFPGDSPAEFLRSLLAFYLYPTGNMMKGANTKTGDLCYVKGYKDEKPVYDAQYGSMGINAGPSMSGSEPQFFWPEGDSLFHTLVLCMKSRGELGNLELNDPPAPWNSAVKPDCTRTKRGDPVAKVSFVSALVFQSRRVVPIVENGRIKECFINNGFVNVDNSLWHDPFAVRLRNSKTGAIYNMQADPQKAVWRNIGNLTAAREREWHIMPDVLRPVKRFEKVHYINIMSIGMVPKTQVAGYDAMLFDDTVLIPDEYMESEELGSYLASRIEIIENAAKCWECYGKDQLLRCKNDANNIYWARIHQMMFNKDMGFLTFVLQAYTEEYENFESKGDEFLFSFMDKTVVDICKREESNTNSWNVLVEVVKKNHEKGGCLHKYYSIMKKYRGAIW